MKKSKFEISKVYTIRWEKKVLENQSLFKDSIPLKELLVFLPKRYAFGKFKNWIDYKQ